MGPVAVAFQTAVLKTLRLRALDRGLVRRGLGFRVMLEDHVSIMVHLEAQGNHNQIRTWAQDRFEPSLIVLAT